jgi:hypothetical protein
MMVYRYYKFINRMLKDRIVDKFVHISSCVPGNILDSRKGFKRFDKWYKLPRSAHKLYWRMQKSGKTS